MSSQSDSNNAIDRCILDAAVARIAASPLREQLVLRGSYLTSHWVGGENRSCADLDFLALSNFDPERLKSQFCVMLSEELDDSVQFATLQLECELIFEETEFPGCRLTVPVSNGDRVASFQIDIGFGDPLSEPPQLEEFLTQSGQFTILSICPEIAFAWKLHGLVEKEGITWRPKDLADLWLLQNQFAFNPMKLDAAIKIAFESRDAPFWRLDRLTEEKLGRTSGSKKRYSKFLQLNGAGILPLELSTVVSDVSEVARAALDRINPETSGPFKPLVGFSGEELTKAFEDHFPSKRSIYREYPWNDGSTFVQERIAPRISPHLAETKSKHRRLLLQRESRGITFDRSGKIIARPYSAFEPRLGIDNIRSIGKLLTQEQFESCEVLEKLDGSLVFPTSDQTSKSGWRLRTRRGRSSIADDAFEFSCRSLADYHGLIEYCLNENSTPIFEWCSRKRIIVLDHPEDRLVLTGIRDNSNGTLLGHAALELLAKRFSVEVIRRLGTPRSLEGLCKWVASLEQSEGLILRTACDRQFKIKSDRYLWLHRAIEGPHQQRACWKLWANGAQDQAVRLAALRDLDLNPFFTELDLSLAGLEHRVRTLLHAADHESLGGRKRLAASLDGEPNLITKLAFGLFDGRRFSGMIRELINRRTENESTFTNLIKTLCQVS